MGVKAGKSVLQCCRRSSPECLRSCTGDLPGLVVFFTLITLHLHIAPYTKIEESFNIQASHDILTFGVPTNNASQHFRERYDHISFPGPVPRTFIGALLLSGLAQPILKLGPYLDRQFIGESEKTMLEGRQTASRLSGR